MVGEDVRRCGSNVDEGWNQVGRESIMPVRAGVGETDAQGFRSLSPGRSQGDPRRVWDVDIQLCRRGGRGVARRASSTSDLVIRLWGQCRQTPREEAEILSRGRAGGQSSACKPR